MPTGVAELLERVLHRPASFSESSTPNTVTAGVPGPGRLRERRVELQQQWSSVAAVLGRGQSSRTARSGVSDVAVVVSLESPSSSEPCSCNKRDRDQKAQRACASAFSSVPPFRRVVLDRSRRHIEAARHQGVVRSGVLRSSIRRVASVNVRADVEGRPDRSRTVPGRLHVGRGRRRPTRSRAPSATAATSVGVGCVQRPPGSPSATRDTGAEACDHVHRVQRGRGLDGPSSGWARPTASVRRQLARQCRAGRHPANRSAALALLRPGSSTSLLEDAASNPGSRCSTRDLPQALEDRGGWRKPRLRGLVQLDLRADDEVACSAECASRCGQIFQRAGAKRPRAPRSGGAHPPGMQDPARRATAVDHYQLLPPRTWPRKQSRCCRRASSAS